MPTHDQIHGVLRRLNDGENRRAETTVEETIAAIDAVMADDVEGWTNGAHTPNREAERTTERVLFALMEDYRRTFDRVIVEPPFASVAWTITATVGGNAIEATGCTHFEVNEAGLIQRYWLYLDASQFSFLADGASSPQRT